MIITAFVIDIAWEHQTTDPALAQLLFDLSNSLALGEREGIAGSLPGPGPFHYSLPSTSTTIAWLGYISFDWQG